MNSLMYWPALPTMDARSSSTVIHDPIERPMLGSVPSFQSCHGAAPGLIPAAIRSTSTYWTVVITMAPSRPRGMVFSRGSSQIALHVEMQSQPSMFQNRTLTNLPSLIGPWVRRAPSTRPGSKRGRPHATNATTGAPVMSARPTSIVGTLDTDTYAGRLSSTAVVARQAHFCTSPMSPQPVNCNTVSQIKTGYTAASATPLTHCQYVSWKHQKSPKASRTQSE
mmetsp:Transcript_48970/g.149077  ORF Transcript_48970/g.149077 Transcript_48970/m.149077 type:complete len:223 (+) Transcript_48970:256-924(+)